MKKKGNVLFVKVFPLGDDSVPFLGSNKIYVPSDYSKAATEGSLGNRGGSIEETYEVDK